MFSHAARYTLRAQNVGWLSLASPGSPSKVAVFPGGCAVIRIVMLFFFKERPSPPFSEEGI